MSGAGWRPARRRDAFPEAERLAQAASSVSGLEGRLSCAKSAADPSSPRLTILDSYLLFEIAVVALCLTAGGILKGATGAGAPILAVPALAALFDVRFAVVVMLMPNLLTNVWQAWRFRAHLPERSFILPLVTGGACGILLGTFALKAFASDQLSLLVAAAVLGYVGLRLARPHWVLAMPMAKLLAFPAGIMAGILQGAAGLSAPVSITFLNAMQLGRERFIVSISSLFATFTAVQVTAIHWNGLIRPGEIWYSLFALLPVSLAMPVGAWVAKRVDARSLDRLILVILLLLALKLGYDALT